MTAGNFRQPILDLSAGAVPTQQLTSQPRNPAGAKFPWFKIILSGITAARHGSATGSASSLVGGHVSDCHRDPGSPSYVSRLARGERRSREIEALLDRKISRILKSVVKGRAKVRKNEAKG